MKKFLALPVLGWLLLAACGNNDTVMTPNAINARVDSLVGARMESLNQQAMEDLDRRMSIEVKAKADSIVAARLAPTAPASDSTAKRP